VCVCVCVREREREKRESVRERKSERERERARESEREHGRERVESVQGYLTYERGIPAMQVGAAEPPPLRVSMSEVHL